MDEEEELDPGAVQCLFSSTREPFASIAVMATRARSGLYAYAATAPVVACPSRRGARTPPTRRPRADDPDFDEEEALQKREAKDLALKKEREALWKRNDLGETALHVAALRGHERVCKWLLERPSCESVDPQDWTTGATPLWNACQAGKLKAAKVLLAKGADPDAAPVFGEYRSVTAKTMALNKHWDDLINETAQLRAEEEARLQAKKERRIRRRNRYNLAVADRDRRIREKEAARLLMIEERQYRAKDRVKKRRR